MANKSLFPSFGTRLPRTDSINEAGGRAYALMAEHQLAQYAATGCLHHTFYARGEDQLQKVLQLCELVTPEFIAKTALFARTQGFMKDMPALLCAVLSVRSPGLLAEIFDRVIDNGKMLRNFVQIMRSGVVGRRSLGSLPKRLILQWLESRTDDKLFLASVGNSPSLAEIIRMVHPKPWSPARDALFGYLTGREYDRDQLPPLAKHYEKFKRNTNPGKVPVPDVPFQMLTSLPLTKKDWKQIARNASWQMTRMNLNTFARHGVFDDPELVAVVANRLRNERLVDQSRVFPYQLMTTWNHAGHDIPKAIRNALQDAMELAIKNVPRLVGQIYVFPDVSSSMRSPVTGHRPGATSVTTCVDVAALVAAAVMRRNPETEVIPFHQSVVPCRLNPRDSVMTNAKKLSKLPSGGTNCSAPLKSLNDRKATGDLIIYVSDNESWIDTSAQRWSAEMATETMNQWSQFKRRSPNAKMVCIDIQPYGTTQAREQDDIINVGGFSDQVFRLLADVAHGRFHAGHWVAEMEKMRI